MSLPTENFRDRAALACFLVTAALTLGLDLWSKWYSFEALNVELTESGMVHYSETYRLIPGFLHFHCTTNKGAVFGLGAGRQVLFVSVSVGAIALLFYLFAGSGRNRLHQVILGMLMAGVLGNLYDRIVHGYVRDMIHILDRWGIFPWIFNVADVLLCTGVGLMALEYLLHAEPKREVAEVELPEAPANTSKT